MRFDEDKKMACRVLRGPYGIPRSGNRADGQPRRFMVLEVTDQEMPEKGEWDYGDDVLITLVSTKGRKKKSGGKQ